MLATSLFIVIVVTCGSILNAVISPVRSLDLLEHSSDPWFCVLCFSNDLPFSPDATGHDPLK